MKTNVITVSILITLGVVSGRIHKLETHNDVRRYFALTTFGFYKGGILSVNLTNFKVNPFNENDVYGFSLDRTRSDAMNPYLDNHQEKCLLQSVTNPKFDLEPKDDSSIIYFTIDFRNHELKVNCSPNVRSLHIYNDRRHLPNFRRKRDNTLMSDAASLSSNTQESALNDIVTEPKEQIKSTSCLHDKLPIKIDTIDGEKYIHTSFSMYVMNNDEEGLYNFFFHSCPNYKYETRRYVNFTIHISEENNGNYLSAGEMPLPDLYFMMAFLFFLSGSFWVIILKKSKNPVFKIHYLMVVLVFLKSFSLLFHGINYHFIQTRGEHVAAWAILYYITHLLKGAVLFITIVLIGTGWDFIKHILADRDKKLFMIVIPLQVLANVAEIIIEESEEGDVEHKTWRDVFILVDLLCCGAILFPVVWSIRHLSESANTDGKAAINLQKLKLFRHFYIMIVCYIYFTRIIMYLLKMTVPFQYEWLDEMFRQMATYIFFVLTGYKFRPASANPYFTVNDDLEGDDDEIDVVLFSSVSGTSGFTEGLGKVSKAKKISRPTTEIVLDEEERDSLINKREASHDFD
ncbi:hypothetical protein PV328_001083 [Microctonus aethiopoides]|uniref:GOST seven transmembrane domain-containing protein n=1 Tax=Microctonus aethiopoides TaxID=144406 RepID=A0AA39FWG0_9HYME|nr:hypothetical protein PV328_001083 [Microctonus aethiopoides]